MKNVFTTLCALAAFALMAPVAQGQINLPVTFEDAIDYELVDFGGNASSLVADPNDASNTVVQSIRTMGAECFAGTTVADVSGFTSPIPFAPGETSLNVRVLSPAAGVQVKLKVEKFDDPTISVEADLFTTVAGDWETLVYDFTNESPGTAPLDFAKEYDKASIFFDFQCPGPPSMTQDIYFWDDLAFGDVPEDIEASLDPVGSTVIPETGGTLGYSVTLTNTTDVTQVFSARIDAVLPSGGSFGPVQGPQNVRLRAGETVGPVSFTSGVPGQAPEGDYSLVLELSMGGSVFATDSFLFEKEGPPSSLDLPLTFEDASQDYEIADFGGNVSSLVADPNDASNTVVQSIRTMGAECFAGTSVGVSSGFASPVPFAPGETSLSVRVLSPAAGVQVKLKVEQNGDPTVSVETDEFTTVAGVWETLVFDFSNESPGTAQLNFASTYNQLAIFFDFQCPGPPSTMEAIYFWDDVEFVDGMAAAPVTASARALTVGAAYPNPFSRATTIPFAVEAATDVRLAVYDVMGREVAVLVNGTVEAGRHEASFEAQDLASGLYVWKLTAGAQSQTGRLTLVR
ncbi:MAG: T9SS type A sorting domain-containing protein [Bacteroidota bacterium]